MIVVAVATTNVALGEARVHIHAGQAWDGDDPVVRAYPSLFSSLPESAARSGPPVAPVEQATARPGERRGTRRAV